MIKSKQNGSVEVCWANNPAVRESKSCSARRDILAGLKRNSYRPMEIAGLQKYSGKPAKRYSDGEQYWSWLCGYVTILILFESPHLIYEYYFNFNFI